MYFQDRIKCMGKQKNTWWKCYGDFHAEFQEFYSALVIQRNISVLVIQCMELRDSGWGTLWSVVLCCVVLCCVILCCVVVCCIV